MKWFGKGKEVRKDIGRQAIVEIQATKDAKKEAIAQAKEASEQLNSLLVENGFTLKIYLATGGTVKTKRRAS